MGARFHDCQDERNRANGRVVHSAADVAEIVRDSAARPPFLAEFEHATGSVLMVGIGGAIGAVQHTDAAGLPFAAIAADLPPGAADLDFLPDVEFLCGGTPTPFHGRWILPIDLVERIVVHFAESGGRAPWMEWETI